MGKNVPSSILAFAGDKKASPAEDKYADICISGKTGKSPLEYQPGEEMVFTFEMDSGGVEPGNWFLYYERKGDDLQTFSGKVPADQILTVRTSLDCPGFVSVNVWLVDDSGEKLTKLDYRGKQAPIGFFAGAGVQIETLSDCGEPDDFDQFWTAQKKRLEECPFKEETEKRLVRELDSGSIYAVTIPTPGDRPATGYMTLPRDAEKETLPILIVFNGYGMNRQRPPESILPGCIFFHLNAHGQKLDADDAYYEEFFKSICTGNVSYAYDPELNKDPGKCFFNGMVMRVLRALEYLKTLPEWNKKDVIASGNSQGGLQTMWAAALDQDVTLASPAVTWCCDMAGAVKAGRLPGVFPIAYQPALDYYDPVFMAKRITQAEVIIRRGGLGDYVCPPSGVAISYKNLSTLRKRIYWHQGSDHGFIPDMPEIITWKTNK